MIESAVSSRNSRMANAILAQVQSTCLDESRESTPAPSAISYPCMQDIEEEHLPLFYQIPSHRIVAWFRWWHLTARYLLLAYQKRYWGLLGQYLKTVKGQGESSPCTHQRVLRSWPRTSVASTRTVIAGEAPLHSTVWQMQ